MSTLSNEYKNSIAPALMTKFSYKSVMQIPKLEKIVINVGAGEAKENSKVIDAILQMCIRDRETCCSRFCNEPVRSPARRR